MTTSSGFAVNWAARVFLSDERSCDSARNCVWNADTSRVWSTFAFAVGTVSDLERVLKHSLTRTAVELNHGYPVEFYVNLWTPYKIRSTLSIKIFC